MIIELACGVLLGALGALLYFEGLWWTVKRASTSEQPYAVLVGSFVARSVLLLVGASAIALWSPFALVASPIGLLVGRTYMLARHQAAPR